MSERVDPLIAALRVFPVEVDGDDAVLREALTDEGERFLRAGGTLSLLEWSVLEEISRDALALAGDRIRYELAGLIGAAGISPSYAAAIAEGAEVDPDSLRVRIALEQATKRVAERIGG